jgi:hypothetical protein
MEDRPLTNNDRYWRVEQGHSTAKVRAPDYEGAKRRAAEIGFRDPTTIVLIGDAPPLRRLTPIRRNWSGAKGV